MIHESYTKRHEHFRDISYGFVGPLSFLSPGSASTQEAAGRPENNSAQFNLVLKIGCLRNVI
jgi:hypothetical protein